MICNHGVAGSSPVHGSNLIIIYMPYIRQELREQLDNDILKLAKTIREISDTEAREGTINYTITELLNSAIEEPYKSLRYFHLNRMVGTLECVKLELYRRFGASYEDKCILQNGDIKAYKHS